MKRKREKGKEEEETVWVWEYDHGEQAQLLARAFPMRPTPSRAHPERDGWRKGLRRHHA